MLKVRFFVEGGKEQGYGHLVRCKTLFDEFVKNGHDARIIVRGDKTVSAVLEKDTYTLSNWPADLPIECDIAILDSYLTSYQECERIAAQAKLAVFFDDINRIAYPPRVVLNGTLTAEKINYPRTKKMRYLLGPKYQLIRPEFLDGKKENIPAMPKSVMITFGGNDMRNLSPVVLKVLVKHFPDLDKNVVVGKSYTNGRALAEHIDAKTLFFYAPGAEEMAQLMQLSDFAICAGGQTLFELAACGTPAAVIGIADNQEENIKGWLDAGFITFAGWHDDRDIETNLLHAVNALAVPGAIAEKTNCGYSLINPNAASEIYTSLIAALAERA